MPIYSATFIPANHLLFISVLRPPTSHCTTPCLITSTALPTIARIAAFLLTRPRLLPGLRSRLLPGGAPRSSAGRQRPAEPLTDCSPDYCPACNGDSSYRLSVRSSSSRCRPCPPASGTGFEFIPLLILALWGPSPLAYSGMKPIRTLALKLKAVAGTQSATRITASRHESLQNEGHIRQR